VGKLCVFRTLRPRLFSCWRCEALHRLPSFVAVLEMPVAQGVLVFNGRSSTISGRWARLNRLTVRGRLRWEIAS
jgi:hypothetical protein